MNKTIPIILAVIQTFIAVGAMPGGLSLIIDPSGKGFGMTVEILEGTPFDDFFIPGLFLFIFLGLGHVFGAIMSFMRTKITGVVGLTLGIILVAWICIQVISIGLVEFLQTLFLLIGLIEIRLGYLLIKETKPVT